MKRLGICIGLIFVLSSCQDRGISPAGAELGTFSYTAFDTVGNVLLRGTLALRADGQKILGTWQFDDGRSGLLEGSFNDNTIVLNLNPGFVDNNLFLRGTLAGNTYAGEWQQIGFPGIMAHGRFSAIRREGLWRSRS